MYRTKEIYRQLQVEDFPDVQGWIKISSTIKYLGSVNQTHCQWCSDKIAGAKCWEVWGPEFNPRLGE